ncbi:MAG: hypothetical protein L0G07_09875 [Chryseobacterium sp.]|nr:hypothetical protein [Chryseobacterium sp.]MDN5470359.1 hypothetical protein [Lactococcus lactis]MDN5481322.1 hypothetical protein [Chryseobacterium sp.]
MGALEKELNALRMKQSRIEKRQREENNEVWGRIAQLEKIALENTGVDAGKIDPSVQIALNKVSLKRYGK